MASPEVSIMPTIQRWFQQTRGGGLILPDGWFGRPHDNQHLLTYSVLRPHRVILELDERLYLAFTDLRSVKVVANELILSGFDQVVFDWQEYGSSVAHASVYSGGVVKFVP